MITWMQKHKKYLIVTIWVSTVAFVGAGFVGWGSVNFSRSASVAATVGGTKVSFDELNRAYANIYDYYNQMMGGKLDKEAAQKMGLEQMALQTLINQALVENYARDLGLTVSDLEVSQKLATIPAFFKNGAFDPELYKKQLETAHTNPKSFESDLRKQLLIAKIRALVTPSVTPLEASAVAAAMGGADRMSMRLLLPSEVSVAVDDAAVKKRWEEVKNNFKSPERLDLQVAIFPYSDANVTEAALKQEYDQNSAAYAGPDGKPLPFDAAKGKIRYELAKKGSKKGALKAYIEFKDGKIAGRKVEKVPLNNPIFPPEVIQTLAAKTEGESVKPFETPQGYMMLKILKKYPSALLSYEEAKPYVEREVRSMLIKGKLEAKAADEFKNFQGRDLGYVTKQESAKLAPLNKEEATKVLSEVFASKQADTTVVLNDKFVLIRVTGQKFDPSSVDANQSRAVAALASQLKENALDGGLLEFLKKRYPIEVNPQITTQKTETK